MTSYRRTIEDRYYGRPIPDEWIIEESPDSFSFRLPSGVIVGWNRCVERFWRNDKIYRE